MTQLYGIRGQKQHGIDLYVRLTEPTLMSTRSTCVTAAIFLLLILAGSKLWAQGPPYQTDDPVPVDLHHYEFYIFGGVDGTPVEIDSTGPPSSSTGAPLPRVQLHAILPWGVVAPSNNPVYLPAGTGPDCLRPHRHGTGRQDRLHQREQTHSADRQLHHV